MSATPKKLDIDISKIYTTYIYFSETKDHIRRSAGILHFSILRLHL
jgi:hypothetical protein